MPSHSAKLCPAISLLLVVWALFPKSSSSFLGGTQRRFLLSSKVPRRSAVDNPNEDNRKAKMYDRTPAISTLSAGDQRPKTQLTNLIGYALGITPSRGDIVYMTEELGDITESIVRLRILKEPTEFRATAKSVKAAENAAALLAYQELEAALMAKGDARRANIYNTPPSSDATPKSRLRQLVSFALGILPNKKDIKYVYHEFDDCIEGIVTLPVLKDTAAAEFKATVQFSEGAREAERAAALVAFQELEPSLMAKAKARMAKNK